MRRLKIVQLLDDERAVLYLNERKGTIYGSWGQLRNGQLTGFEYHDIWPGIHKQHHWSLEHLKTHLRGYFDRQVINEKLHKEVC